MLNLKLVKTWDLSYLEGADVETVQSSDFVSALESRAEDPTYETEPGLAFEFYSKVDGIMSKHAKELKLDAQLWKRYEKLLLKLSWPSFNLVKPQVKQRLFSSQLVASIKAGSDPERYLKGYLDLFESGWQADNEERQSLVYGLTNNEETIGTQPLMLKTQDRAVPSIKNWIKDFNSYLPDKFAGGKFEQINYFNNSQNVSKLPQEDKDALSKLIELYTWLKYPKIENRAELRRPSVVSKEQPIPKPAFKPIPRPPAGGLSLDKLKNELQIKPVNLPEFRKPVSPNFLKPQLTPAEIKREVSTKELPGHEVSHQPAAAPHRPAITPITPVSPKIDTLDDIKFVEDLKRIAPEHLRRGTLSLEVPKIKSKIAYLASVNRLFPYEVVAVFEQSPLFKAYLAQGSAKVVGQPIQGELNQAEFEAVADLKKEIERM